MLQLIMRIARQKLTVYLARGLHVPLHQVCEHSAGEFDPEDRWVANAAAEVSQLFDDYYSKGDWGSDEQLFSITQTIKAARPD